MEADDKAKYVRVMSTDAGTIAMDDIEDSSEDEEGYDSDVDGDLFLYQMGKALDGIKEELPKINFRRKHPQLGKKLANVEQRLRRLEGTVGNLKQLLAPYIIKSIKDMALRQIDEDAEDLIYNL